MDIRNLSLDKHLLLQFKSGLREQQRELLHTIENAEKDIRDFSAPVPLDPIDLSCYSASKESLFARASQDRGRLRLIQQALERINDGSFGICAGCEGPIGLKRLQALPWASHCIQCQEQAEVARLAGNLTLDMTLPHRVRDSGA
jgi:DnaK suppressor protein